MAPGYETGSRGLCAADTVSPAEGNPSSSWRHLGCDVSHLWLICPGKAYSLVAALQELRCQSLSEHLSFFLLPGSFCSFASLSFFFASFFPKTGTADAKRNTAVDDDAGSHFDVLHVSQVLCCFSKLSYKAPCRSISRPRMRNLQFATAAEAMSEARGLSASPLVGGRRHGG